MFWLRILLLFAIFARYGSVAGVLRPRFGGTAQRIGDDTIYWHVSRSRKRRQVDHIAIAVDLADSLRFSMRSESAFDGLAKSVGLAREWQTGDAQFDPSIYVLSNDQRLLDWLSVDAELRRIARELIEQHAAELHCTHGRLWISCPVSQPDETERNDAQVVAEFTPQVLPKLLQLRDRVSAIAKEPWVHQHDPQWRRRQWIVGLCAALGVAGVLAYFWHGGAGLPHQMVFESIDRWSGWAAVGAVAMLLILLLGLIRRSAYTHLILIEIVLVGVPGAWFAAHASLVNANQRFDAATPTTHIVRVTKMETVTGRRNRKTYYVSIDAWPDTRAETRIKVTPDLYRSVREGGCLQVTWHPGYLGDPWVSQWRVLGMDCLAW